MFEKLSSISAKKYQVHILRRRQHIILICFSCIRAQHLHRHLPVVLVAVLHRISAIYFVYVFFSIGKFITVRLWQSSYYWLSSLFVFSCSCVVILSSSILKIKYGMHSNKSFCGEREGATNIKS